MSDSILQVKPASVPPLDPAYQPAVLGNRAFLKAVRESGKGVPLIIGIERNNGALAVYKTQVFGPGAGHDSENLYYAERVIKFLLWQKGGHKVIVGGPAQIGDHIKKAYSTGGDASGVAKGIARGDAPGPRAFDANFMGMDVYEKPFTVVSTTADQVPPENERFAPKGGNLDGCRIGFDAGASDRKVAAVIDGKSVYSEEVIWNPKEQKDPSYHFNEINAALKAAAAKMPRVDAIGVSSAGVYIDNRAMVASLFRGVANASKELFDKKIKPLFLDLQKAWGGIPMEVCNDGEVTALAGAMNIGDGAVLGIAMGSSEAAGYVTSDKFLTEWLDELAFAPIDYNPNAPEDEWSKDIGCGVQYFSQVGAIRLATAAGIALPREQSPAEKLKTIQETLAKGDPKARQVFESIGCYLGYTLAHYSDFYDIRHVLVLGRVVSGDGGNIIMEKTRAILKSEFPDLGSRLKIHLPEEEAERRVGQAIAAASLPVIKKAGK